MADPVADELVASLARPGGNVTGTTFLGPEPVAKQASRVARGAADQIRAGDQSKAARDLGLTISREFPLVADDVVE